WVANPPYPGVETYIYDAVAPGSLIPLTGSGLAASSASVAPPLPRELGGVRIRIGAIDAAVQSVSPDLVWLQVPWELPAQQPARFGFVSGDSPFETPPGSLTVQATAPHSFGTVDTTNGNSVASTAVHGDWSGSVTAVNPAAPGEVIVLYFNGLGPV